MGRKAKGREILESAKAYLSKAKTAEAMTTGTSSCFSVGIWHVYGANSGGYWCIAWLGMPTAQSFHERGKHF